MSVLLHGIEHLSPSGASLLVDCERRYWWRYKHGLGKAERSEALAMGHGLATALEFGDLERGLVDYDAARPAPDGWTDPIAYEREGWIGRATIRRAFGGYNDRYQDEGIVREQTYLISLSTVVGRVIQARVDGCVPGQYLVEDKLRSASSLRADAIENEVRQGRQLTAEVYAHWKATGELLPVRFRLTKKIDPRKVKKLETQAEVESAIAEHFTTDGVFNEFIVTRTEQQLLDFEAEFADLTWRADNLLSALQPSGARNEKACNAYGRTCPAIAHCQGLATVEDLINKEETSAAS